MRTALIHFARRIRNTRTGTILRTLYHTRLIYGLFSRFFKMYFGFTAVVGLEPRRASDRGPAPTVEDAELRRRYRQSAAAGKEESFVLYRIIGNDLVPRHRKGQSRENLQFILEHEPELKGCEKRFVLNRIVDGDEEVALIALLESHGFPYLRIPFSMDEYAEQTWDLEGLPEPGYTLSRQYDELPDDFRARLFKRLYRHKNNYLINNNGARNTALEDGRGRAKWILPWDGNCFLTEKAWEEIRVAVTERPWYPYVIVPMARIGEHAALLDTGYRAVADQEPQVLFRRDSGMRFDENYYYGRRPKVELLWRLGVPGPWDEWAIEPWDLPYPEYCNDAGAWQQAGWVARLPSGKPRLEHGAGSETLRLGVRTEAVNGFLQNLDAGILFRTLTDRSELFDQLLFNSPKKVEKGVPDRPVSWSDLRTLTSRHSRRGSRRAIRRAEQVLLSYREFLPLLLRESETAIGETANGAATIGAAAWSDSALRDGDLKSVAEQLLDWLQGDAGARAVRRRLGPAGTLYDLYTLFLAIKLERYDFLSRSVVMVLDRARKFFPHQSGEYIPLKDEVHRSTWFVLEKLVDACGENLWSEANRPEGLDAVGSELFSYHEKK